MATETFTQDAKSGKWSIPKDPDATLDYIEDWTAWLDGVSDTIASAVVTVTGATLVQSLVNGKTVIAWISGGVAGTTVAVKFHITTNSTPARQDDRTCYLKIKER